MHYVDGFVLPIPTKNIDAYRDLASKSGKIWIEHGALSYVETVLEDNEDKGFCLTFSKGITLKEDETVVFAFITYKSREHRDEVNAKVMQDARLKEICDENNMPFDCARMLYGGFRPLVKLGA